LAIEKILSAIKESDDNDDKLLNESEVPIFLEKIKDDNSDSAKIAREKIKSLKDDV